MRRSHTARHGTPMNVGEIVAAVDVVQSTVSAHLEVLAEVRFLLAEHRGTATYSAAAALPSGLGD